MDLERIRWWRLLSLVCVAAALATACADTGERQEAGSGAATWTSLTTGSGTLVGCQGCHSGGAPAGGLSLTEADYTAVTTMAASNCGFTSMVTPGTKETSVLYVVLTNPSVCTLPTQGPMPNAAAASPDVGAWIDGGALQ